MTNSDKTALLEQLLKNRSFKSLEDIYNMTPEDDEHFRNLYSELLAVREALREFASGNFDGEIALRGAIAGYLKTLQANLRHLAWQVEQVAEGDFSQHVDFMDKFSTAFNSLTL